jgi:hypothetical protein
MTVSLFASGFWFFPLDGCAGRPVANVLEIIFIGLITFIKVIFVVLLTNCRVQGMLLAYIPLSVIVGKRREG